MTASAAEMTATRLAVRAARAEETGSNRSVQLMVLLTFHRATLAATTHSEKTFVFLLLILYNKLKN